jgi:hypothetical protein
MTTTIPTSSAAPVRLRRLRAAVPHAPAAIGAETVRLAICAGITIVLLAAAAADDGGYSSVVWLGGAIGLVAVAVWARLVFGRTPRLGRWGRLALAALALYAVWSYASILWATDKGTALIGANRALLYLVLFWLFAGLSFTRRRLELSLAAYLLAIGALAVAILGELAAGPAPQLLINGQLAAGLGYHNATAALGTIGAAGSILASCSRSHRPLMRAGLVAGASACIELSLLAQSRGWLYTLPVIVVTLLVITPQRGRAAAWAWIPALAALATLPWVRHGWALIDGAAGAGHQTVAAADLHTARVALIAALVSGVVAWLFAHIQRRYVLSRRGKRAAAWLWRTVASAGVAGAAAGAVLLVSTGKLAHGWHQFTTDASFKPGVSRFVELGSGRYDLWRVAVHSFLNHPVGGLGQDNFAQAYVAARHTTEEPLWAHSLELRLLAHTGLVGLVLFCAFIAFAVVAWRRAAQTGDRRLRLALATALVPLTVWVVHGSVDWFWELPALSGAAFAFLGAVVALEPGRQSVAAVELDPGRGHAGSPAKLWRRRAAVRFAGVATVLAGAALALVALVPTYLGERALGAGRTLALANPAAALRDLSLAARFEPFNSAPLAMESGIELRTGHGALALRRAREGIARDPGNWLLWLEYGLAAGAARRPALERSALAHARSLDPREPVIALAQRRAGTRHPLTIADVAAMLSARAQARVRP